MFDNNDTEKTDGTNYWKMLGVIVAGCLIADLISGAIGAAIATYQINAATTAMANAIKQFPAPPLTTRAAPYRPPSNPEEARERKAKLIMEECRFWIDRYNTEPTKENAGNRLKACKPVGTY